MSDEKTITERIAEFAEFKSKPTTGNMDYERMAHLQSLLAQAEKIVKDCEKEVNSGTRKIKGELKRWHTKQAKILSAAGVDVPMEEKKKKDQAARFTGNGLPSL